MKRTEKEKEGKWEMGGGPDRILGTVKSTAAILSAYVVVIVIAAVVLYGCERTGSGNSSRPDSTSVASSNPERKVLYWYDPMNPTLHLDHPGKSPVMDMDLVPRYADEDEANPNIIRVDPVMVQNIGVVTAPVERRRLTRTISTYGVVMVDEEGISDINTRVGGWIDKLFLNYTGMEVAKGQPIAVIYSPDLISAEQEFLSAGAFNESASSSGSAEGNLGQTGALVRSARERLKFFGMNDAEIDSLQSTGKIIDRVVIHSPADGIILDKSVVEGQNISSGQSLFRVANLHQVWILADVFKIDMPFLKMHAPANVENANDSYSGQIDFIYPEVDPAARSVKVRIPLNNPGMVMKIGQYVNVAIHSPVSYEAIAVPSQAVINTGARQVVALAIGEGKFEIREVKLGAYADGFYEVTDGLRIGDTIVTSGQFLLDSDANLNSAGSAMSGSDRHVNTSSDKNNSSGSIDNLAGMNMKNMDHDTTKREK